MFYLFVCFVATESQNILIWKVWGWLEFFFVLPTIKIKIDRNIYMEKFLQRTMFRNFLFGGVFPLWSATVGLTSASLLVKGFKGLKRVPIANRFFFSLLFLIFHQELQRLVRRNSQVICIDTSTSYVENTWFDHFIGTY